LNERKYFIKVRNEILTAGNLDALATKKAYWNQKIYELANDLLAALLETLE